MFLLSSKTTTIAAIKHTHHHWNTHGTNTERVHRKVSYTHHPVPRLFLKHSLGSVLRAMQSSRRCSPEVQRSPVQLCRPERCSLIPPVHHEGLQCNPQEYPKILRATAWREAETAEGGTPTHQGQSVSITPRLNVSLVKSLVTMFLLQRSLLWGLLLPQVERRNVQSQSCNRCNHCQPLLKHKKELHLQLRRKQERKKEREREREGYIAS